MKNAEHTPIRLRSGDLTAEVSNGELVSLVKGGREYMHKAGEPGWGHSDTEMFPIIGPTADMAYRVQVPRGNAMLDQHGLLREMPYSVRSSTEDEVILEKIYTAGTPVHNSKFPDRSQLRMQIWPYGFRFTKRIKLFQDRAEVAFEVHAEKDMPYMLGYHPAFAIRSEQARVKVKNQEISLKAVLEVGDRALHVPDCDTLILEDETSNLEVRTEGFGHFMLWSPDPGMLCIEPITFYPYNAPAGQLHEGFEYAKGDTDSFSVTLLPGVY